MRVIDPGHVYLLDVLDGRDFDEDVRLTFVKREGPKYPGNVGSHSGTTSQEVLRALIERCAYVDAQRPCDENLTVRRGLIDALIALEMRAARIKGTVHHIDWDDPGVIGEIITGKGVCPACGHVRCKGHDEGASSRG